ncbi:MAG TPA: YtxH domain-containing protein [Thermomicrobiaceae bacterium]|nr:YtxH domain-containing protein [Thermomicrobiaceae bacterium]
MGILRGLLKFVGGGLVGAAVGAVAAVLLAPQSGPELQAEIKARLAAAQQARTDAEEATTRELQEKFRVEVHDPDAFKPRVGLP